MQLATYDYALLPVYAALAYRVYKHTPRLNDPVGARMGCKTFDTASTRQFHLMLAGDSSAVGVGVATQAQATMGATAQQTQSC